MTSMRSGFQKSIYLHHFSLFFPIMWLCNSYKILVNFIFFIYKVDGNMTSLRAIIECKLERHKCSWRSINIEPNQIELAVV